MVKDPPAEARDTNVVGLIPGSGRSPGEGNGNPLQRSLGGYCPWGCKELDTTKHTHTHTHTRENKIKGFRKFGKLTVLFPTVAQ